MRLFLSLIVLVSVSGTVVPAAALLAPLRQSQQFTVIDARPVNATSPGRLRSKSGAELIRLDADVLLLTAERVRELLVSELNLSAERAGRIRLVLFPALHADEGIGVIASFSPGEWDYRIQIPDQVESETLVRGLVHAVLLETANRGQGPRSAELPLWLVEGLTWHLLSIAGPDLVIGTVPIGSMLRIVRERHGLDYLKHAREVLRANPAISFSRLAHPTEDGLKGENLQVYQCSAQLFVYELLHLKQGSAKLVALLHELPSCWNWETALLRAFPNDFHRLLDVEKKWSVDVLAFTARDPSQVWSRVVCLDRLDGVLTVPAQFRRATNSLPERKTLTFQQVISSWDFASQSAVLRQKIALLEALRFHSSAELVPLIDSYHRTLAIYLHKRDLASRTPETRMQTSPLVSSALQDALRDLELLDNRRQALRPENELSVNSR